MHGFGYGAEDFDAGLSEAIGRARKLIQNVYTGGGTTASRPAGDAPGFPHGPGPGTFGGPLPEDDGEGGPEHHGPEHHGHHRHAEPAGPGVHAHTSHHEFAGSGQHTHMGPGHHGFGGPGDDETGPGPGEYAGTGPEEGTGPWAGWDGPWGRGFSAKDWAGFFGGPRGGWWQGPGGQRRPGGPGGPGGPRGPRRPKASRGDVRATILALLIEGPRTGYQIMSDIEERSRGAWRPSPGAVYPALQLLADEGLIIGDESGGRRTHRLTDAGREYVENNPEMARGAWEAMAGSETEGGLGDLPRLFGETARLGAAIAQTAHAGTPDQIHRAERLLKQTRRTLYEFLADEDTSDDEPGSAGE
jgi:DNA-binding PadR family transcriptional regulator